MHIEQVVAGRPGGRPHRLRRGQRPHTLSCDPDRQLGGHDSDVSTLGLLTLIAVAAIAERIRGRKP
jgi:hypothetical protein